MTDVIYLDLLQTEDGVEHQATDDDFNLSEGKLVLRSLFAATRVPAAHDGGAASVAGACSLAQRGERPMRW
jgi:hypothetical protein